MADSALATARRCSGSAAAEPIVEAPLAPPSLAVPDAPPAEVPEAELPYTPPPPQ